MFALVKKWPLLLAGILLAAGCADRKKGEPEQAAVHVDGSKYQLADEPQGARGVIDLKKESKDGDAVVVVGKVAGRKNPFFKGAAGFLVVDLGLKPEDGEEDCIDFC